MSLAGEAQVLADRGVDLPPGLVGAGDHDGPCALLGREPREVVRDGAPPGVVVADLPDPSDVSE